MIYQVTHPDPHARTTYAGNLPHAPTVKTGWEVAETALDQLPDLPTAARRMILAAHTAGHRWQLMVTPTQPGEMHHGKRVPQHHVDLPDLPHDALEYTRWSWVDGRIDYRQYSGTPITWRDAMARLTKEATR